MPYFTFIARIIEIVGPLCNVLRCDEQCMGHGPEQKLREAFLWSVASGGEACIASSHPAVPTTYVRLSTQCTASLYNAVVVHFMLAWSHPSFPPHHQHREIASSPPG